VDAFSLWPHRAGGRGREGKERKAQKEREVEIRTGKTEETI
jgi:hypothetical protein